MSARYLCVSVVLSSTAFAQDFTAAGVNNGKVLFTNQDDDGNAVLTEIDPQDLGSIVTTLGPGVVSDLEGGLAAFLSGDVMVLDTGAVFVAPFGEVHAVASSGGTTAFGNTTELAFCDDATGDCTFAQTSGAVQEITAVEGEVEEPSVFAVLVDGEVLFFKGTVHIGTLRTGVEGVRFLSFRMGIGTVGGYVGPCMVFDATSTDEGMLLPGPNLRLVDHTVGRELFSGQGISPHSMAAQLLMQGPLTDDDFVGDFVFDMSSQIVNTTSGLVLATLNGESTFQTAVFDHQLGPPVVARALGSQTIMVDDDGPGPLQPYVIGGSLTHFAEADIRGGSFRRRGRDRRGWVFVDVEIPGQYVGLIDFSSVTLAGVSPAGRGPYHIDPDGDGEPGWGFAFKRKDLAAVLPNGVSTVEVTGATLDGFDFSASGTIEIRR